PALNAGSRHDARKTPTGVDRVRSRGKATANKRSALRNAAAYLPAKERPRIVLLGLLLETADFSQNLVTRTARHPACRIGRKLITEAERAHVRESMRRRGKLAAWLPRHLARLRIVTLNTG